MTRTPCRGCKDKVSGITGNFKMRFVGRPEGKLMKGAPGNYEHGKVYVVPYRYSTFKFWELIEHPPELKVPDPSEDESVFESTFLPPEEIPEEAPIEEVPEEESVEEVEEEADEYEMVHITTEKSYEKNLQKLTRGEYEVDKDGLIHYDKPVPSRKELKKKLDEAGVDYNQRTRTPNLIKMVEKLDEVEE